MQSGGVVGGHATDETIEPPFVRRLRRAGFEVDEVKVRARGGSSRKGGAHHVVWIATRG